MRMSSLRRVAGLSLKGRVRSSKNSRYSPILKSASWGGSIWLGYLLGTIYVRYSGHVPPGGGSRANLGSLSLCAPLEELEEVAGGQTVWISLLRLLTLSSRLDKQQKIDGWMVGRKDKCLFLLFLFKSFVFLNKENLCVLEINSLTLRLTSEATLKSRDP